MNFAHFKEELAHLGQVATKNATALSNNLTHLINSEKVTSVFSKHTPRQTGEASSTPACLPVAEATEDQAAEAAADASPALVKTVSWDPEAKDTVGVVDQEKKKVLQRSTTLVSTPKEALEALMSGNERFLQDACLHPHQSVTHLKKLCNSQKPFAAVLGCADSRVPPEILFDQGFGDLFVCRVAGNLASPEQVASLEYAVAHLHIQLIMILGHAKCGACGAALADILHPDGAAGHELEGHLDVLVDHLAVAVERGQHHHHAQGDKGNLLDNIVKENVLYQVERLSKAPVIKHAIQAGQIKVVGAYYDLDTHGVSLVEANVH